ncbi:unnamed protein product [Schistosoma margrebowiei]|uniref:Uncharacterized protein n=1 Tax=Schistosoma margrebowiei TaxID=48269 RepID=A0A183MFE9_9TREM|nr:unnamed protein product [Schistosoma margrebowiei]
MNTINQTELQMVDTNNLQNPCEINHELTKPLVLFLNSRKEVLSSAPTSPNSSDNDISGPITSIKFQYRKDSRKCFRKITSQTNWRKRQGITFHCGPFFSRTHNGLINSPYQSDISQSAPSSPTIDTYETLPLISNVSTIDQVTEQMNSKPFNSTVNSNLFHMESKNDEYKNLGSSYFTTNKVKYSESTLLCLMQRLGIQTAIDHSLIGISAFSLDCLDIVLSHKIFKQIWIVDSSGIQNICFVLFGTCQLDVPASQSRCSLRTSVWPCLLEHGVVDVDRLSKLTRNELIEMGVTDAETRATLMTAAQLLTDSWLNPSLFHKTLNRSFGKNSKDLYDTQNIHDSGISSGTDITSSCLTYKPQYTNFCNNNNNESKSRLDEITSGKSERMEHNQSRWGYGQQMPTEHNGSVKMASYEEINLNTPIRQNVGSYQTINSDKNSFQNGKYLMNLLER